MKINLVKTHKTFEGKTQFWTHESEVTKTQMNFSTYIPDGQIDACIIWLSGLTCTEENFITKSGVGAHLTGTNTMIICPDTSPRNLDLPGEHLSYDFGSGAGFYVDATTEHYKDHYLMYSYVDSELTALIKEHFGIENLSIMGHSMGGHGALVIGLKAAHKYKAISAFSPICHPSDCPWGEKALSGYLGEDRSIWKSYDSYELIASGYKHDKPILVDQGTSDEFLESQLKCDHLKSVCDEKGQRLELNLREGYDHSYYFISTFLGDHIKHHQMYLL